MARVTHIEVGYVRQTQPVQYEKAEPSIKFTAALDEEGKDNHLQVASGLLIDAQVLAHAALGSPLPEKIKNAWIGTGIVQSFLPVYESNAKPAQTPVVNTPAPVASQPTLPAALTAQVERERSAGVTVPAPQETKAPEEKPADAPKPRGRPKMTEEQKKAAAEARAKTQAATDPSFIPAEAPKAPAPAAPAKPAVNDFPDDGPATQAPATVAEDKVAVVTPPVDQSKEIAFETIQAYVQNMVREGKIAFQTVREIVAAHGGGSTMLADVAPARYAAIMAAVGAAAKQ